MKNLAISRRRKTCVIALSTLCLTLIVAINSAFAAAGEPMLYLFTSNGCAPCIQVKHTVQQLDAEGYPVTTVNVNERPDWADAFRVTHTPTLVLVRDNEVLAWQPRPMRAEELRGWFRTVGFVTPVADAAPPEKILAPAQVVSHTVGPVQNKVSLPTTRTSAAKGFTSPTMHHGTRTPANPAEQNALDATVLLQVKDPTGTSFATGTVIHSQGGESLVLTCGHVFRDSAGKGEITAELGFDGQTIEVPGELLDFDSNANDIALVAIQNGSHRVAVVDVALSDAAVDRGQKVFSIGCDRGEDPTIRHTAIKNLARYDGSLKYDIFGRPVNGRSGGGLFDNQGKLIGLCNAAAVEVDEGIYTALETIHGQIKKSNLAHLFDTPQRDSQAAPVAIAATTRAPQAMVPIRRVPKSEPPASLASASPLRNVSFEQAVSANDDQEVLITIRSKSDPSNSRTITISDPTPKLLDYLGSMESDQSRSLKMAHYRTWH